MKTMIPILVLAVACAAVSGEEGFRTPRELSRIAHFGGRAPNEPDAFHFVVVSDRTGGHVPGLWAQTVQKVNLMKPDFIISVGDLIEGYTPDPNEALAEWEEFDAISAGFDAPFFYCPGNHDVTDDLLHELYVQRYGVDGRSYYSFDYRGCHFVVLDSYTAIRHKEFADEQIAWLAKDMTRGEDPRRVFVFYHHPFFKGDLWSRVTALLPPDKTTIFTGHGHALRRWEKDGFEVFMLGPSGTGMRRGADQQALLSGHFPMFAHVAVASGEPKIAFLPLADILPAGYAQWVSNVQKLFGARIEPLPLEGGRTVLTQKNPTDAPAVVRGQWRGAGWQIEPARFERTIPPGGEVEIATRLERTDRAEAKPTLAMEYTFPGYRGKETTSARRHVPPMYGELKIPKVENISVDGALGDWQSQPFLARTRLSVIGNLRGWSGPDDASWALYAGVDNERLYVAIDVTDDEYAGGHHQAWKNDAVEFFWDARPAHARDGGHGPGTGQVILPVPKPDGKKPDPQWFVGHRETPDGFRYTWSRRQGGYVVEFSLPLSELGGKRAPGPGETLNLEVQLDDCDMENGRRVCNYLSSTGEGGAHNRTTTFIRGTIEP